jgi:hypothetical protein
LNIDYVELRHPFAYLPNFLAAYQTHIQLIMRREFHPL